VTPRLGTGSSRGSPASRISSRSSSRTLALTSMPLLGWPAYGFQEADRAWTTTDPDVVGLGSHATATKSAPVQHCAAHEATRTGARRTSCSPSSQRAAGCSLRRILWEQEAESSNLSIPTQFPYLRRVPAFRRVHSAAIIIRLAQREECQRPLLGSSMRCAQLKEGISCGWRPRRSLPERRGRSSGPASSTRPRTSG